MTVSAASATQELSSDGLRVEILPAKGARLHRLTVRGIDLLRTPADSHLHTNQPFFWGAYNMAPWCNRIDALPTRVGEQTIDVAANFRDGSAIHGQVYDKPWATLDYGRYLIRAGADGWPWPYEVSFTVSLDGPTVQMTQTLRNLADEPMPAGIGLHPWFDGAPLIAIHAAEWYPTNTDSRPQPEPVSGAADLRNAAAMARGLDGTWVGVTEPQVELLWPQHRLRATMRSTASTLHVTAASPTEFDAIAVEPQSHGPQGLRRLLNGEPGGLAMLEPTGALSHTIELTFAFEGG